MKVSPNQNNIQTFRSSNVLPQTNNNRSNVAFGSAKTGFASAMHFIEKNGFLCDFLVVDALSMIIPRIVIGLLRDKDKTGKLNYKAGAEEAGREVISGPSMMLIPMGIMATYKQFAPATHMNAGTLRAFTNHMSKIVENNPSEKADLHKKLADKLFDDAFINHDLENREQLKSEFNKLLNESTKIEKKFFSKNKAFKEAAAKFEEHVALINNKNKNDAPTDTKALSLDTGIPNSKGNKNIKEDVNAKALFEDFRNYSKDIITKFSQKTGLDGKAAANTLEKMQRTRAFAKISNGVIGFLAVGAFLLHLPKIYQVSKTSPAMESAKRAQKEAAKGGTNENS